MFELGNNLREARQGRRIDLVVAEQDTKIRSKYLAALETEDFEVLPGPVFVRGFLRTYSRYLGLDPQLFIDEYNARFGRFEEVEDHASPALGRPGLAQERVQRGRRTMRVLAILSLCVLAALAWMGLRDGSAGSDERTEPGPSGPSTADLDAGPAATSPARPANGTRSNALGDAAAAAAANGAATRIPPATSTTPRPRHGSTGTTATGGGAGPADAATADAVDPAAEAVSSAR